MRPYGALIRDEGEGPPRLTVVKLLFRRCKERTKARGTQTNEERNMYIDDDVDLTYGKMRPLHRVRKLRCRRCPGGERIVPVDPGTSFISYRRFTAF